MIQQSNTEATTADTAREAAALPWGDHYRSLLRRLNSLSGPDGAKPRSIGVTSCTNGEGVSTVAVNLALHAATDLDEHTLLIDLSPTQSSVAGVLGGRVSPGLSDMLLQSAEPAECIRKAPIDNFAVLGIGSLAPELNAGFDRNQVCELLVELRSAYEFVVVDLPTASDLSGCYSLAGLLDGILLVVEAERVRGQVAQHVKDELVKAGASVLGVIFNKRRQYVPEWLCPRVALSSAVSRVGHTAKRSGRLTATQRGLPEYGWLIESTMTGRARRRASRCGRSVVAGDCSAETNVCPTATPSSHERGMDSVLADNARRRSSLKQGWIRMESLLQRTPLGRG